MRRVSMTVTVQTMRSAAAIDVDVSAWRYLQVCYTNALVIFFSISDSFSDLVSLLCVCITEKPGVCPRGFDGVRLCKELCVNDIDCPNDEKCCRTKCGHSCTSPF